MKRDGSVRNILVVRKQITKYNKERMIPLSHKAKQAIQSLYDFNISKGYKLKDTDVLLVSQKKTPMTTRQVQRIVKEAGINADLDIKVTPHTLRHTFATQVYRNTKDLRSIQKLLGHSYLSTTAIYTEVTREDLKTAVDSI
jgi:site-specific recombinase XerD